MWEWLFPKNCLGCGESGRYVCDRCRNSIKRAYLCCPTCGKPAIDGTRHPGCKGNIEGVLTMFAYEGIVRRIIHQLKYGRVTDLLEEVKGAVKRELDRDGASSFTNFVTTNSPVIIPIPLFWLKENRRGFNQAEELGRILAEVNKLEMKPDLLRRIKATGSQTNLSARERGQNVQGIFRVNNEVRGANIILVDDVWTTGATMKEAAKVMKKEGVEKIWGWTLAK